MADPSVIETAKDQVVRILQVLSLNQDDRMKVLRLVSDLMASEPAYGALIDLADEKAVADFIEPITGAALQDYFLYFFPGGRPEMLEEFEIRNYIKAAVAKLKRQRANEGK